MSVGSNLGFLPMGMESSDSESSRRWVGEEEEDVDDEGEGEGEDEDMRSRENRGDGMG